MEIRKLSEFVGAELVGIDAGEVISQNIRKEIQSQSCEARQNITLALICPCGLGLWLAFPNSATPNSISMIQAVVDFTSNFRIVRPRIVLAWLARIWT